MTDLPDEDGEELRVKLTTQQRLALLERDARSHARSLTEIVQQVIGGFTQAQIEQLRTVFREELADAGLRIDGPDHIDDAREDFRFLRRLREGYDTEDIRFLHRLREGYDGAAKRVGNYILMALFAVGAMIVGLGFWAWISRGIR